jgi:serine/threonine protein phosphatase PrpC
MAASSLSGAGRNANTQMLIAGEGGALNQIYRSIGSGRASSQVDIINADLEQDSVTSLYCDGLWELPSLAPETAQRGNAPRKATRMSLQDLGQLAVDEGDDNVSIIQAHVRFIRRVSQQAAA